MNQRTVVDNVLSEKVKLECGVFQGAPLGPLLFIIYINDIAHMLDKNNVFYDIYADDTVIVNSGESDRNALLKNQYMLQCVMDWCDLNRIVLNQKKTKHMYVSPRRIIRDDMMSFETMGETIECVREFKYLGVTLDDKLSFETNVERVINMVNVKLISLSRLRKYMDMCTSLLVYKQMILPLNDYMSKIAESATSRVIKKLQPLQNRAVKIILGINMYVSTEEIRDMHVQLFLVKLAERRKMFMLKLMFKYSQCDEYVNQEKPKIEVRNRPKVKMKLRFTKRKGS